MRVTTRSGAVAGCVRATVFAAASFMAALLGTVTGHAAGLTWDVVSGDGGTITDGSGNWSDGGTNWNSGTGDTVWSNAVPDTATIGGGTNGAAGTIVLTGPVTAGGITFNLPNGGGAYVVSGNTLTLAGTPTIRVNADATINSVLAGEGVGFTKTGAGTLTLSGANTYTGPTTLESGGIVAALDKTLNAVGGGGVDIGAGAGLRFENANTINAAVSATNAFTGSGTLVMRFAAGTTARNTTLPNVGDFGGTIRLSAAGATGDKWNANSVAASNATLVVDGGCQLYVNTATSTFGLVEASGTGNSENRGALRLANVLNAPLRLMGDTTIGPEGGTISGDVACGVPGTNTLTVGSPSGNGNLTISGSLSDGAGVLALVKAGTASGHTLILSGDNSYTGPTTVNRGILDMRHANALGGVGADSATRVIGADGNTSTFLRLSNAGAGMSIGETLHLNAGTGGRVTLENNSAQNHTLSGPIDVSSSGTLVQFNSSGAGSITVIGDITGTMSGGALLFLRGSSSSANNRLLGSVNLTGGNLSKTDGGTWLVGAPGNTYSWANTQVAVGTLVMGTTNILRAASTLTMGQGDGNGATLNLNGFSQSIANLAFSSSGGTKTITSAGPATLTLSNATDNAYGGILAGAGLSLVKNGAGTLTLTGGNTMGGAVALNEGNLTLGVNGTLAGASAITIAEGTTLSLSGAANNQLQASATAPSLSVAGTLRATTAYAHTLYATTITLTDGTIDSTGGVPANWGAFFCGADRTITASGAANALSGDGRVGIAGGVALTLDTPLAADAVTVSVGLGHGTGGTAGGLTKAGEGTVTLTADNTYTGPTTVNGGTLTVDGALANANITVNAGMLNGGGTLHYRMAGESSDRITLGSSGTIDITGLTLDVVRSGGQSANEYVVVDDKSRLTGAAFAAVHLPPNWSLDYDGTSTHSNAVVLVFDAGAATAAGTWDGGDPTSGLWSAALNWDGDVTPDELASLVFPSGASRRVNTNDWLSAVRGLSLGGDYMLYGDTLSVGHSITNEGTNALVLPLEVSAARELAVNSGVLSLDGPVSGVGGLVKSGAGTLAASALSTYEGSIAIEAGTVALRHQAVPFPAVTNLKARFDASAITGLVDGATVNAWPDTSGNGNDATRTAGAPVYVANGGNGMPVVRFQSDGGSFFNFAAMNDIYSVFFVGRELLGKDSANFFLGDSRTSGGTYNFHRGDNDLIWHGTHAHANIKNGTTRVNGAVVAGTSTTFDPGALKLLDVVTSGGAVYANSISADRQIAGRSWNGDIAEILIYNRALTAEEVARVEEYLMQKWGLGPLPQGGDAEIATSGALELNGLNQQLGALGNGGDGGGLVTNGAAGTIATLTVGAGNKSAEFDGVLADGAGAVSLNKIGTGTLTLGGSDPNTARGLTTLVRGVLMLDKAVGPAIAGDVLADNVQSPDVGTLADNQFGPDTVFRFASTYGDHVRLELLGTTQTLAGIDNSLSSGYGVIQQREQVTAPSVGTRSTLILNGAVDSYFNGHLRNSGGTLALVKSGSGTLTLAGGNITFSGGTAYNEGGLILIDTTAFASPIEIAPGLTLESRRTATGFANRKAIMGNAISGGGVIEINNSGTGLAGGWTTVGAANAVTFSGMLNINSGTFSRDNTSVDNMNCTATVNVAAGACFGAGRGGNCTIGALTGAGDVGAFWSGANAGSLTVGNGGTDGFFSGSLHGSGAATDGSLEGGVLSVVKIGAGRQVFEGASTYAGTTTVRDGTLVLNNASGSATGTNTVRVAAGGTLAGTGGAGGLVRVAGGGCVAPGDGGVGTLTVDALALESGWVGAFELNADPTNDVLVCAGELMLNGGGVYLYAEGSTEPWTPASLPATYALIGHASLVGGVGGLTVLNPLPRLHYAFDVSDGFVRVTISGPTATPEWTGGGVDAYWSTASNWTAAVNAGDTLVFGTAGPAKVENLNDFPEGTRFGGIVFENDGVFTLAGNVLELSGSVANTTTNAQTIELAVGLTEAGQAFNALSGDLVVTGPLGGTGGLVKTGPGTVVLSGTNVYSGSTVVSEGPLVLGGDGRLGGGLYTNPITLVAETSALVCGTTADQTLAGVISGAGVVRKPGTGTLTLAGTNTFVGGLALGGGVLRLANVAAMPVDTVATVADGAQFDYAGFGDSATRNYAFTVAGEGPDGRGAIINSGASIASYSSLRRLTLAGDTRLGPIGNYSVNDAGRFDIAYGGALDGGGYTLTVSGGGVMSIRGTTANLAGLIVENAVAYSENVNDSLGARVTVRPGGWIGAYGGRVNGATIDFVGGGLMTAGGAASTWTGTLNLLADETTFRSSGTIGGYGASEIVVNGLVTGPGRLRVIGTSWVRLTADNDYAGGTVVDPGSYLLLGNNSPGGSVLGPITDNGILGIHHSTPYRFTNDVSGAGGMRIYNPGGQPVTFDGTSVALAGSLYFYNAALILTNNPSLTFSQAYLGNGNNNWGRIEQYSGDVTFTSTDATRIVIVGEYPGATSYYNLYGGTVSATNGFGGTYIGWSGAGQLNVYGGLFATRRVRAGGQGGQLLLHGGELRLGAGGIDNTAGAVTVRLSGGTLSAYERWSSAVPMTLESETGDVTVTPRGNTITLSGVLSGFGGLRVADSLQGTLVLTATNAYAGATTVASGALQVGNDGATGTIGAGPVTVEAEGTLRFSRNNICAVTNTLSGDGTLELTGGTLSLGGDGSAFAGTARLSGGTLVLDYTADEGNRLGDGATLALGGGTLALAGGSHEESVGVTVVAVGTTAVRRDSGSAVLQLGALSSSGGLIVFAESRIARTTNPAGLLGPWAMVGDALATVDADGYIVAFTGYTDVPRLGGVIPDGGGIVRIVETNSTSGNITLAGVTTSVDDLLQTATGGPATIDAAGRTLRLGAEGGLTVPAGVGALTIGGAADSGTLTAGGAADAAGRIEAFVGAGNTCTVNARLTDNGAGAVSLSVQGGGRLSLAGGNTFSGGTEILSGELQLRNSLALGGGDAVVGSAGLLSFGPSGMLVTNDVRLDGGLLSGGMDGGTVNNTYSGTLTLGPAGGTVATWWSDKTLTVEGRITGDGALTIATQQEGNQGGNVVLAGSVPNDYRGATILTGGTSNNRPQLGLAKTGGAVAIPGDVIMSATGTRAIMWAGQDNQFGPATVLRWRGSADTRFELKGTTQTVAGLDSSGFVPGTYASVQHSEFGAGAVVDGLSTLILNVGAGETLLYGNPLSSTVALRDLGGKLELVKNGGGTQALAGTLIDFTGATVVNEGTLLMRDLDDMHTASLTIGTGTTVEFANTVRNFNRFSATVITGDGTFVKSGRAILTTGNATGLYARWAMTGGLIDVREGEFRADYQDQTVAWVNNRAALNVAAGALVSLVGGNTIGVDVLTGEGTVQNINAWGTGIITVGQGGGSGTFDGLLRDNGGPLGLTKTGGGTQSLVTANTHSGPTTVNGGTLRVANTLGSATGSGAVNVIAAGTLSGTGSIAGTVSASGGGRVAPGDDGVGILHVGALTLQDGGALALEFETAPGTNDVVDVAGVLSINGGGVLLYAAGSIDAWSTLGTYNLVRFSTFAGTADALSVLNPAPGRTYRFGTDGNWLTLTIELGPSWTGAGANGDWTTAENWTNGPAAAGLALTFGEPGAAHVVNTNTFPAGTRFGGITFANDGTYTFDGNAINLTGNVVNDTVQGQTINLPLVLEGAGRAIGGVGDIALNGEVGQDTDGRGLTKSGAGTLTLNAPSTYTGNTTIEDGTLAIGGSGRLAGGAYFGAISLAAPSSSLVLGGSVAQSLGGVISGGGAMTMRGDTTLTLGAANSYAGGTTISRGTVRSATPTGMGTGAITLGDAETGTGDVAWLFAGALSPANAVVVTDLGTGTATIGTYSAGTYTQPSGALTLNRPTTLYDGTADRTTFSGKLSGHVGTLTVAGTRITLNNNANDFVGDIVVSAGSIYQNDGVTAVPATTLFTMNTGSRYRLNNNSPMIGALIGLGTVDNVVGANTLTIGGGDASGAFDGSIENGSGAFSLAKTGAGTQALGGTLTYTGATTVNGGTLLFNGTKTGAGNVTVNSGGALGGTGTVAGATTVNAGGRITPGAAGPGTLTLTGGLALAGGSALDAEIGVESDTIRVSGGTFAVTGSGTVAVRVAPLDGIGGDHVLVDWTGASSTGVELADFTLVAPPGGLASATLVLSGSKLILSVPDGTLLLVR